MAITTVNNSFASGNPLHAFRTYSYHHVLLACVDSSIVEDSFTNIPFDQLLPFNNGLGNVDIRTTPRYVDGDINKPYIVLINTMVDAEFLIKSLTVNIIPAPPPANPYGTDDYQYARSAFNFGGNLVIEEPFGVRFGDLLAQTSKKLKADPERIVFVLKTAFYGYTDQGSSIVQQIKPLSIAFLKMDATFTAAGGRYEMEFVTYANGFANRKELANIGGVAKFQVDDGKLTTAMKRFADVLNTEQKKVNEANSDLTPVTYEFILHEPFTEYSVGDSIKAPNKNKNGVQFNASLTDSITTILEKVMMLSPQVREDLFKASQTKKGTQTNPKTDRSVFKIYSNVTNKPNLVTVTYHIYPHKIAVLPTPTEADKEADPTILKKKRQDAINLVFEEALAHNNLLEYNYIYSGLNIDVIDFEMKLDLFSTYRMYYIEESHIDAKSQIKGNTGAGTNVDGKKAQINLDEPNNSKKIQFIGDQPKSLPSNIKDAQEFYKFNQYLSRAVSFTGVSSFLTIAGDPRLYSGYLKSPINPDGTLADPEKLAKEQQSVMTNWALLPAIVKMNVYMPNPPTAVIQDQTVQQAFRAPFWYDGAFQILSIVNTFGEDGKFTQRLEMIQVPCDYNIPDLTEYVTDSTGQVEATTAGTAVSSVSAAKALELKNEIKPTIDISTLTDGQKKCLAHAYVIATGVNMPPEVLQAILLVDSQACKVKDTIAQIGTSERNVHGATYLSIPRVQNYLRSDSSLLNLEFIKNLGAEVTPESVDSIRVLLTRSDDFNLRVCAKIWIQDRDYWKKRFGPNSGGDSFVTERTIVGHNNSVAINTVTPMEDMQVTIKISEFSELSGDDFPSDDTIKSNAYLKSVESYYPLVKEFNSKLLPKLLPVVELPKNF